MKRILDRRAFAVTNFQGAANADKAFWAAASRDERLAAVEVQRRIAYGYETAPRLQRVLEVARQARR
jgi:hypothetical protein